MDQLVETGLNFEQGGRNSYPDFRLVQFTEGYELKGLAYPGRDATFDSNSQVPTGLHNGRSIYYVFGRYPKRPDGDTYPVLDLVITHGDFLNAEHEYVHENKSVKGFGTYGDLMIRDRKMYVVPTPFRIADGLAHQRTLILPSEHAPGGDFIDVGELVRREAGPLGRRLHFRSEDERTRDRKGAEPSRWSGTPLSSLAARPGWNCCCHGRGAAVTMPVQRNSSRQTISRSNLSRHWRNARVGVKRYTGPFTTSTSGGQNAWALSSEG